MKSIDRLAKWMEANRKKVMVLDDTSADMVVKALMEYVQYKEIGTVEDLKNLYYLRKRYEDETYDYCGEYGTSECGAKAQLERLKVYEEIGAAEEIKKAVKFLNFCYDSAAANDLHTLAEYKKIGTVEEITKVVRFLSLDNDNGIIEDLQLLNKYRLIGTLKECQEARESQKPKKPNRHNGISICPECGRKSLRCYDYCPGCGQAIDWSET